MCHIRLDPFDRQKPFTQAERDQLQRMIYHLVNAASQACFLHIDHKSNSSENIALAICDRHGLFFEVQPYGSFK